MFLALALRPFLVLALLSALATSSARQPCHTGQVLDQAPPELLQAGHKTPETAQLQQAQAATQAWPPHSLHVAPRLASRLIRGAAGRARARRGHGPAVLRRRRRIPRLRDDTEDS